MRIYLLLTIRLETYCLEMNKRGQPDATDTVMGVTVKEQIMFCSEDDMY